MANSQLTVYGHNTFVVLDMFSHKMYHFTCARLIFTCGWVFRSPCSHVKRLDHTCSKFNHVSISDITWYFAYVWLIEIHTWLSFPFHMIICETTRSVTSPAQTHVFSDNTYNLSPVLDRFLHLIGSFVPHVLRWNHAITRVAHSNTWVVWQDILFDMCSIAVDIEFFIPMFTRETTRSHVQPVRSHVFSDKAQVFTCVW